MLEDYVLGGLLGAGAVAIFLFIVVAAHEGGMRQATDAIHEELAAYGCAAYVDEHEKIILE